jgi:hypothetical protein
MSSPSGQHSGSAAAGQWLRPEDVDRLSLAELKRALLRTQERAMLAEEVSQQYERQVSTLEERDRHQKEVIRQKDRVIESISRERDAYKGQASELEQQVAVLEKTTDLAVRELGEKERKTRELEDRLKRLQRRQELQTATIANPHLSLGQKVTSLAVADEMARQADAGEDAGIEIFEFPDKRLSDLTGLSRQHAGGNINALAEAGIAHMQKRPAERAPADGRRKQPGQPIKFVSLSAGGWEGFLQRASTYGAESPADELIEPVDGEDLTVEEVSRSPRQLRLRIGGKRAHTCPTHGCATQAVRWCPDGQHVIFPSDTQGDASEGYRAPGSGPAGDRGPRRGPNGHLQRLPGSQGSRYEVPGVTDPAVWRP